MNFGGNSNLLNGEISENIKNQVISQLDGDKKDHDMIYQK